MKKLLVCLLVMGVAMSLLSAPITTFSVQDTSNIGPLNRYVKGGIPLPEGKYKSIDKLAVLDKDGKQVRADITLLNTWLDGSVKWTLVDFADEFLPGQKKEYQLCELDQNNKPFPVYEAAISKEYLDKIFEISLKGEKQDFIISSRTSKYPSIIPSQNNPLLAGMLLKNSLIMTGTFEGKTDKTEKADFYCKVEMIPGMPGYRIQFSLTANGEGDFVSISKLTFKVKDPGELNKVLYEKGGIKEQDIGSEPVSKGVILRTPSSMNGWFAGIGKDRTTILACEDFAELCPTAFVADKNSLSLEMYNNDEEPYKLIKGSATTHFISLQQFYGGIIDKNKVRELGTAALNTLFPVCTTSWYCSSKAFGNIAASSKEKFPKFETIVESNFKAVNTNKYEYGIKDYGDYRHADHWGDQHYDLPYVMFQQFMRSGELRFLNKGIAAARHMMDVDTIWNSKRPDMVGGVYVEQEGHNLSKGTYMGFAKNHGTFAYYYLTGDERALEAGKMTGDFCAYWSKDPKNYTNGEERIAGYGLLCLIQAYKATHDTKYLTAAKGLIDGILKWQDKKTGAWVVDPKSAGVPRPKSDTNGCVFMLGCFFEAMIDYYEITKDEEVKTAILKGNEYMINTLWKDGPEDYSINLLVVHAPAWCYAQTKDKKFIDAAINAYMVATKNPNMDWVDGKLLAQHWRAASRFLYIIENDEKLMKLGGF